VADPAAGLLVGVVLAAGAGAGPGVEAITLRRALELAAQHNPELAAAGHHAEAAEAQAEASGRVAWPRLLLGAELWRSDNAARVFMGKLNRGAFTASDFDPARLNDPEALSHFTAAATLEAPLDVFGKLGQAARGEQAAGGAARAQADERAQDVRLRVVEAYWQAALSAEAVAATEKALAGARAREADLEARVSEGAALQADLLRVRARRREREADLAERQGDQDIALAALTRELGLEAAHVPSEQPPVPPMLAEDDSAWIERALGRRGSLAASRRRAEAAAARDTVERRTALPDLAAYGQVQEDAWSGDGRLSASIGLLLRWSVFDASRGRRTAASQAQLQAFEAEARGAEAQVRFEVRAAWRRARSARARLAAAGGGAVEAREALRVVQERRQAGMATLTDELETEAASLAAELQELRAVAEAALADAALARAAGEL
jgi:outer membrane protein TolC